MQIEVSFSVWKQLTSRLADEHDTYDAVIGRLVEPHVSDVLELADADRIAQSEDDSVRGAMFKGVFLPNGTRLRASHRGKTYFATIVGSQWQDDVSGEVRSSPSQAAYAITKTSINGWQFWLVKRPQDSEWHSLHALRGAVVTA